MIGRYQQKKQALDKLEDILTQLWNVNLLLWSHKERGKVLNTWNKVFDVKEILESELEKNKEVYRDERKRVNRIHRILKMVGAG